MLYLFRKVRNVLRGLLQTYGPKSAKRWLWNIEFSGDRWDCLHSTSGDCVYLYIKKYANNGSILDLGCGSGSTGNALEVSTYRHYTGVDISDVAIHKARTRTEQIHRADRNRYLQSDIFSYVPTEQYDVILLRESIYYIPYGKIEGMLERYSRYLKKSGVFIVRIWSSKGRYATVVDTIERKFQAVEKHYSGSPKTVVLVFRPKTLAPPVAAEKSAIESQVSSISTMPVLDPREHPRVRRQEFRTISRSAVLRAGPR